MAPKIHLCFVAYEYLPHFSNADALLDDFFSLTDIAESLVSQGCQVSAVVRFKEDAQIDRAGVKYHFVKDRYGPRLKFWQLPRAVHKKVKSLQVDVVHTHNMNKVLQHNHLANVIGPSIPLIVQNHAEWPAKWLRTCLQQLYFPKLAGFIFCAPGQEKSWLQTGILRETHKIHFVMEGSTFFTRSSRLVARQKTGLSGDPVFLWVGNLNGNKDPITVLEAFSNLLHNKPNAQLYLVYRDDDLLHLIKERIAQSKSLEHSVRLLGWKERTELEGYYNSADYFVLGSHREGSGYSLMEAMACGCVPIVTDIPSFRMMTNNGSLGSLWKSGDPKSAYAAMRNCLELNWPEQSLAVRAYFDAQLSNEAIAQQLLSIYRRLLAERS